jgi:hypothetical protein
MKTPAIERFLRSLVLDYEKWHDGEGYDLEVLAKMAPAERAYVLEVLLERLAGTGADWRDVDAVAALDTPPAEAALRGLSSHVDAEVRLRAARRLAERGAPEVAEREVVRLLTDPDAQTPIHRLMTLVEEHPTAKVREALLACALDGAKDLRVHAAALALYLAGGANEPFDWKHRPLFLKFGGDERGARVSAMQELQALMAAARPDRKGRARRPSKGRPPAR